MQRVVSFLTKKIGNLKRVATKKRLGITGLEASESTTIYDIFLNSTLTGYFKINLIIISTYMQLRHHYGSLQLT